MNQKEPLPFTPTKLVIVIKKSENLNRVMQIADFIKFCYPDTLRTDAVRIAKEFLNPESENELIELCVIASREIETRQKAESLCLTINIIKQND